MKKLVLLFTLVCSFVFSQEKKPNLQTPPMGFMTWNFFGLDINEEKVKSLADAMVETGLRDAGYNFIFIDDGWQGGRDAKNNIIADAKKFPSGMKALADYVHSKGMKIGIYSDAAPLTCGGYTGSLNFEEQDAQTFASWDMDYLKYDYCNAPTDWQTAINRYETMAKALKNSGRNITLSICEWGDREPWLWAKKAGGELWRTTADIRDKWKSLEKPANAFDLHRTGAGIMDIVNINAELDEFAGAGAWNDPDMLVVGLYGAEGPSGDLGGIGCTDTEYQSQMSLWCLMASPLMITNDVRNMNEVTKNILMNKDIIAVNQDILAKQAKRVVANEKWQVYVKPLSNGDYALGILNLTDNSNTISLNLNELGIYEGNRAKDLWNKSKIKIRNNRIKTQVASHETKVFRISK